MMIAMASLVPMGPLGVGVVVAVVAVVFYAWGWARAARFRSERGKAPWAIPPTGWGALHVLLAPVAWIVGVPWPDAKAVGNLMGTKLVLNEFVAFSMLGPLKGHLAERSYTIATYALCGFANFSSIGIQIGGIGALAPSRRQDLARLGFRALLAGTMANYLAAAIAGLLLG